MESPFLLPLVGSRLRVDCYDYTQAISASTRGAKISWSHAANLLEFMATLAICSDVVILNAIITSLEKSGQWQRALSVAPPVSFRDTFTLCAIIAACRKGLKWPEALLDLDMARSFQNTKPNKIACSAAISACETSGEWQHAIHLFQASAIPADVISFSAAISSCEKAARWRWALQLFEQLMEEKLVPDVIIFNAVISSCEKGHQWQRALLLLQQMPCMGVQPNRVSFNSVMSAFEKGHQWEMALELLFMNPDLSNPDVFSFSAAISACEKVGNWQRALHLLYFMSSRRVFPNNFSFNAAMSSCEKGSQWQIALQVLNSMTSPDVWSFCSCISACEKSNRWQFALQLFEDMLEATILPNQICFNALIGACEKGQHAMTSFAGRKY